MPWPKNVRKTPLTQLRIVIDMQYMAIEFMPTTIRGSDHARQPCTSITQKKVASIKSVQPVLKTAHDGVQMRLTSGQTVSPSSQPTASKTRPAATRPPSVRHREWPRRSHSPAIRPKMAVAIDGTKLSVA